MQSYPFSACFNETCCCMAHETVSYCLLDKDKAECLLFVLCWDLCCGLLCFRLLYINICAAVNN